MLLFALWCVAAAASPGLPAGWQHPVDRLQYTPTIQSPSTYKLLATSTSGSGKLYEVALPNGTQYGLAPAFLIDVSGTATEAGEAYGELVGSQIETVFANWVQKKIPKGAAGLALLAVVDWLWRCSLQPATPSTFLDEIKGVAAGGAKVGAMDLAPMLTRLVTMATLPADQQNLASLIKAEAARHHNSTNKCAAPPATATVLRILPTWKDRTGAGFCDFFAAWGSNTEGGRLLSSRNLDFDYDTGLAKSKLVTVYRIDGQQPHATYGFAGMVGALGGMSSAGMTVSEANLDNGAVGFNGIAWPLRLRHVLAHSTNLAEARALWVETENTAAFNFLIGSASDAPEGPAGVALETCADYTAEFTGGGGSMATEAKATFTCINGTVMDGAACHWPGVDTPTPIGSPLADAVFRANHGLHPDVMQTQEPVWNDTVMRYYMMHDRIAEAAASASKLTAEGAVDIVSLLGQKGGDYGSCAVANQAGGDPSNIMSIVYDPSVHESYVAWEDHAPAGHYMPAACNTYIHFKLDSFFAGKGPP